MSGIFINEICHYLADNSDGKFHMAQPDANLVIGNIVRGRNGIFVVESPSAQADIYTPIEYFTLDFFIINQLSDEAIDNSEIIYELFHQEHHYSTTSWRVFFSHATGQPVDLDRDSEGRKVIKLSVLFIAMELIS